MKHLILRGVLLAAFAPAFAIPASAGELKLSMQDGRVTIMADNVPLRQILQEWARVGQTQILNADKLSNQAITLQLVNAPEREALDVLLRSANGYIAAPRAAALAGAASFDRVTIFVSAKAAPAQAAVANPPTFQRPALIEEVDDVPVSVQMPPQMQQMLNQQNGQQFPGMQGIPPQLQQQMQQNQLGQPNQGLTGPMNSPLTSPRPGALPQPGGPGGVPNPYQPQVIKPGGGPGGPGDGPGNQPL